MSMNRTDINTNLKILHNAVVEANNQLGIKTPDKKTKGTMTTPTGSRTVGQLNEADSTLTQDKVKDARLALSRAIKHMDYSDKPTVQKVIAKYDTKLKQVTSEMKADEKLQNAIETYKDSTSPILKSTAETVKKSVNEYIEQVKILTNKNATPEAKETAREAVKNIRETLKGALKDINIDAIKELRTEFENTAEKSNKSDKKKLNKQAKSLKQIEDVMAFVQNLAGKKEAVKDLRKAGQKVAKVLRKAADNIQTALVLREYAGAKRDEKEGSSWADEKEAEAVGVEKKATQLEGDAEKLIKEHAPTENIEDVVSDLNENLISIENSINKLMAVETTVRGIGELEMIHEDMDMYSKIALALSLILAFTIAGALLLPIGFGIHSHYHAKTEIAQQAADNLLEKLDNL